LGAIEGGRKGKGKKEVLSNRLWGEGGAIPLYERIKETSTRGKKEKKRIQIGQQRGMDIVKNAVRAEREGEENRVLS